MSDKIKMIAIDMDGTLLRDDCSISERTKKVLEEAGRQGFLVTPATGRSYRNAKEVLKGFSGLSYFVNANGSVISDGRTGELLYLHAMDIGTVRKIYEFCKKYDTYVEAYIGQDAYMDEKGEKVIWQCGLHNDYCSQLLSTNVRIKDYDEVFARPGIKVGKLHILAADIEQKDTLMKEIDSLPGVHPISVIPNNIEIVSGRWSKWDGLLKLADAMGIDREEIMAIGDSSNDFEMLSNVGYPVAMGNAGERIKEICDLVTDSNNEDGVAKAIEKILK